MDKIFSLDISSTKVVAIIVERQEDKTKIIDRLSIEFPKNWMENQDPLILSEAGSLELQESNQSLAESNSKVELIASNLSQIEKFYLAHQDDIVESVLIIPADNFIGLNFKLPFNQESLLKKVIFMEVQDLVPFPLDSFYLNYKILDKCADGTYNIFTCLIPKTKLSQINSLLAPINFKPDYITIPSAVLPGDLLPTDPTLMLMAGPKKLYLSTLLDQQVKTIQVLDLANDQLFPETEVKMLIHNFEHVFEKKVESLAFLGNHFSSDQIAGSLNLPVKHVSVLGEVGEELAIQAAQAVAVHPEKILCNFKDRAWNASKPWNLFLQFILKLQNYLFVLLLALLLIPVIGYFETGQKIRSIQNAIRENIVQRIPWIQFPVGRELETLMATSGQIEAQLESLGSPAKSSPVDVYLVLSEILAEASGPKIQMDLQELTIKGNQVDLEGTVPNYKGVDRLEKIIKDKKDVFCRIKVETPGGGTDKRFQFKIKLC